MQSGNIGAAARAMKNMGLRRLAVVAPRALDIDRARWMAPGATDVLDAAVWAPDVATAVAGARLVLGTTARGRHNRWPAVDLDGAAAAAWAEPGEVAVLFGPEDSGLGNDDLAHAHALLHIPTDAHASLNLAQATLLVAAAFFGQATREGWVPRPEGEGRRGGPARDLPPGPTAPTIAAPAGALEPLVTEWMATLDQGTYLRGHEPVLVANTLRRLLTRAALDHQEISVLRGMMRKLRWRMSNPP